MKIWPLTICNGTFCRLYLSQIFLTRRKTWMGHSWPIRGHESSVKVCPPWKYAQKFQQQHFPCRIIIINLIIHFALPLPCHFALWWRFLPVFQNFTGIPFKQLEIEFAFDRFLLKLWAAFGRFHKSELQFFRDYEILNSWFQRPILIVSFRRAIGWIAPCMEQTNDQISWTIDVSVSIK